MQNATEVAQKIYADKLPVTIKLASGTRVIVGIEGDFMNSKLVVVAIKRPQSRVEVNMVVQVDVVGLLAGLIHQETKMPEWTVLNPVSSLIALSILLAV